MLDCHASPGLRGRTGCGITIAVIDSGIHAQHPHILSVAGGIAIDADGRVHADIADRLGHGTAVAAAIQEKAPGVELWVVRVFHDRLATRVGALVKAIEWAGERGIRLINLSLGTAREEHRARLDAAVTLAGGSGTLVVAACEDQGRSWWPGASPSVLGVRAARNCPRHALRIDTAAACVEASPYPRPIPGVPPEHNLNGISFAVANTTAILALALEGAPHGQDADAVLCELERLARHTGGSRVGADEGAVFRGEVGVPGSRGV